MSRPPERQVTARASSARVAHQLMTYRLRAGMTQEQLAREAGITMRTVQRAEAGRPCFRGTVRLLAGALGTDAESLTTEEVAA